MHGGLPLQFYSVGPHGNGTVFDFLLIAMLVVEQLM